MRSNQPVIDVLDAPNGKRVSQLLFGEKFEVAKTERAYSFGQMQCGYQGWVQSAALAERRTASHSISTLGTFIYAAPDMKSEVRLRLPFGAKVKVQSTEGQFAKLPEGYVFAAHLSQAPVPDFVATAEQFIGIPYLWGGRSSLGIDCSGLAQMALHSAGIQAPRDSGPQAKSAGKLQPEGEPLQRGDLVFWNGHVGLMQGSETLLHATAFSMRVMAEPLATTVARIEALGYGEITAIRRL
ncbi:MAG: NLP/P60 hydrolase [Rhodobacteraceae bacterium]|nr:NLP/P60 hydrolase [Paracoccaceae bacterium]